MMPKMTMVWKVIPETLEGYIDIVGAIGEQLGVVSVAREYYLLLAPISREVGKEIEMLPRLMKGKLYMTMD